MWLIAAVCYAAALAATVAGVLRHINIFRKPVYLLVPLVLAVFVPLSIVFLLPLDYVLHNSPTPITWLPDRVILALWKFSYWTTFALTWLVLPVLQEFYRLGHHDTRNKVFDAMKRNLRFQLVVLGVGLAAFVYLVLEVGFSLGHVKMMVIAVSHLYALILALWLMAHGLISLARNRWREGNIGQDLAHQYAKVPRLVDQLEDTKISFREDVLQVVVLAQNFTRNDDDLSFRDWILQLYGNIPGDLREQAERQPQDPIDRSRLTPGYMTKLTGSFNLNLHKYIAYSSEFESLLVKVVLLEDVAAAKANNDPSTRGRIAYRLANHRTLLSPRMGFLWHCFVEPVFSRVFSVVLFAASFVVIQLEFFHSTRLSLMNVLVYSTGLHKHNILQFLVLVVFFLYMLYAAMNALTRLKVFNMYHLVIGDSDPVSACFYTTYIARLTIPLSYNFITLFVSRQSVFEEWFGKLVGLTGLFLALNDWIPRLVFVPVVLTVFNVYDRLKQKLGLADMDWLDQEEDDDDQTKRTDLLVAEAKRIVNRELLKRQHAQDRLNSGLRPFNLSGNEANDITASADLNYEANRRSFHDSLANRVDYEAQEFEPQPRNESSLFGQIGGAISGFRDSILARFGGGYRDDPLEYDYDEDANDNLVL